MYFAHPLGQQTLPSDAIFDRMYTPQSLGEIIRLCTELRVCAAIVDDATAIVVWTIDDRGNFS